MPDSSRPHGLQPARLCPRDFPGKSTGVGCNCLLRTWVRHCLFQAALLKYTTSQPQEMWHSVPTIWLEQLPLLLSMQQSWKAFGEESIHSVPVSHISFVGYFQPNSVKLVVWSLFLDQGNRDFPGDPVVETLHFNARVWVPFLVGELRSHMSPGQKTKQKHFKKWKTKNKEMET